MSQCYCTYSIAARRYHQYDSMAFPFIHSRVKSSKYYGCINFEDIDASKKMQIVPPFEMMQSEALAIYFEECKNFLCDFQLSLNVQDAYMKIMSIYSGLNSCYVMVDDVYGKQLGSAVWPCKYLYKVSSGIHFATVMLTSVILHAKPCPGNYELCSLWLTRPQFHGDKCSCIPVIKQSLATRI